MFMEFIHCHGLIKNEIEKNSYLCIQENYYHLFNQLIRFKFIELNRYKFSSIICSEWM